MSLVDIFSNFFLNYGIWTISPFVVGLAYVFNGGRISSTLLTLCPLCYAVFFYFGWPPMFFAGTLALIVGLLVRYGGI